MAQPTQPNLTKREIVLKVFEKAPDEPSQKNIRDVVQLTLDTIVEALLARRNVELRKFGVFEIQPRKARIGRNPKDPEKKAVPIPARAVVRFKAGKELRDKLKHFKIEVEEVK